MEHVVSIVVSKIAIVLTYFSASARPDWPAKPLCSRLVRSSHVHPFVIALVVSRTSSSFEDRTFAAAGPQVWNSLPPNLRLCGLSYGQFRRLL